MSIEWCVAGKPGPRTLATAAAAGRQSMATAQLPSCPQHHRAACYSHGQTGRSATHSLNGRDFKRWSKFYITVVQTHWEIIMYEENARDLTAVLATTSKSCVHSPGELTRKIRNVRLCSPSSGRCGRGRWLVFYEKPETISRQRSQLFKLMPHADIKKPTNSTQHEIWTQIIQSSLYVWDALPIASLTTLATEVKGESWWPHTTSKSWTLSLGGFT